MLVMCPFLLIGVPVDQPWITMDNYVKTSADAIRDTDLEKRGYLALFVAGSLIL